MFYHKFVQKQHKYCEGEMSRITMIKIKFKEKLQIICR